MQIEAFTKYNVPKKKPVLPVIASKQKQNVNRLLANIRFVFSSLCRLISFVTLNNEHRASNCNDWAKCNHKKCQKTPKNVNLVLAVSIDAILF